jgi:acetoin:2,6-dichlorophenolindophenol oxidoreductase subunit beta
MHAPVSAANPSASESGALARISYMEAIVQAQMEEMHRDHRVILMGEDLSVYGDGLMVKTFDANRVWNTPISENSFAGMAIGAAMTGLRPIVALSIASFMYLPSDQIINQAAKLRYMTGGAVRVPVVFRCSMYYDRSIAAQHSDRPYPMFMNAPGLKILAPASPADMKGLLKAAVRDDDPIVVFEDATLWTSKDDVPTDPNYVVPIGSARVARAGQDATIVAIAGAVKTALAAADALAKEGVRVEVIDPRTLVPMDMETILNSVAKTGRLVLVDNAHRTCNAGAEIAAMVTENGFSYLRKPIVRLSTPDVPIPFSPALEKLVYIRKDDIVSAVKRVL